MQRGKGLIKWNQGKLKMKYLKMKEEILLGLFSSTN